MNRKIIAALLSFSSIVGAAHAATAPAPAARVNAPASQPTPAAPVAPVPAIEHGPADMPAPPAPELDAKAWLLLDATSGQIIASQNGTQRVDPASLTKIMTAYLVFQALQDKVLDLNQKVKVSVNAWKVAPGSSKMFIEPGKLVSVDDLLSGLLIQSGNDAAVALAEATSGAESTFVERMNQTAAQMGLKDTHFASPHGLPDPQTYSTAQDLATLAARLIHDFPDLYTRYDTVRSFRYNNITQPNRNRLLWVDPTVDGLKTGHTEAAGYCMIASAKRPGASGQRRLIAVVMGTPSDKARTSESGTLLNWGFQNFETLKLYAKGESLGPVEVWKGKDSEVNVGFDRDVYATVPRAWVPKLQKVVVRNEPLIAPLPLDGQVGHVALQVNGNTLASFPVVALQPVAEAGIVGRGWDSMRLWVHGLMHDDKPPA